MSKQYRCFEAIEEILNDGSKVFIILFDGWKYKMFYDKSKLEVMIKNETLEEVFSPTIHKSWIDTKWTLENNKEDNVNE